MSIIAYIFVVLAIVTVANTDLVCPGYGFVRPQEPCVDKCSLESDHCPNGKKCCYTPLKPCGNRCLVPKDDTPKDGTCPLPKSHQDAPYWGVCDLHFCDVDNDCQDDQKCCLNSCRAKVCISPK